MSSDCFGGPGFDLCWNVHGAAAGGSDALSGSTCHAVCKSLCCQLLKAPRFEDKEFSLHSHMRGFCVLFAWFLRRGNKHLFIISLVLCFVSFSVA